MNGPAVAKSCTFLEFLKTQNDFVGRDVSNGAARQILGRRFSGFEFDANLAATECIRLLNDFHWIGITEQFEASMSSLASTLGSPPPSTPFEYNRTFSPEHIGKEREIVDKTVPSLEEVRVAEDLNRIDRIIYDKCSKNLRAEHSMFSQ
jgi:hypothetical protein